MESISDVISIIIDYTYILNETDRPVSVRDTPCTEEIGNGTDSRPYNPLGTRVYPELLRGLSRRTPVQTLPHSVTTCTTRPTKKFKRTLLFEENE